MVLKLVLMVETRDFFFFFLSEKSVRLRVLSLCGMFAL